MSIGWGKTRPEGIERSILSTMAFFDLFNYPLTLVEIRKWSGCQAETDNFWQALEGMEKEGRVNYQNGFYFLPGRSELVDGREERYLRSRRRWQKLRKVAWWWSWIPFLRLVAGCNTLMISDIKRGSDIDVFIITAKNRLWLTRALVTLTASVLGSRRHGELIENRICLSFFVDEGEMNLSRFSLGRDDVYFNYWLTMVVPVLGGQTYQQFLSQNNWLAKIFPNWVGNGSFVGGRLVRENKFLGEIKKGFERLARGRLGDWLEAGARRLQWRYMKMKGKGETRGKEVVVEPGVLKFHENDRRGEFRQKFEARRRRVDKGREEVEKLETALATIFR